VCAPGTDEKLNSAFSNAALAWQREQQQLEMAHEKELAQLQQTGKSMRPNVRWL